MEENRSARILKNTFFNFVTTCISMLAAIGNSILIARFLQPDLFGRFRLYTEIIGFVQVVALLGIPQVVQKYLSEYMSSSRQNGNEDILSAIFFYAARIQLTMAVVIGGTLFLFSWLLAAIYKDVSLGVYLRLGALALIPLTLTVVTGSALSGLLGYRELSILSLVLGPVSFVVNGFILLWGGGIKGLIIGGILMSILSMGLSGLFLYYRYGLRLKGIPEKKLRIRMQAYNMGLTGASILDKIVWGSSETFLIGLFRKKSEIGFYSLGFNLVSNFIRLIPSSLSGVLLPEISEMYGRKEWGKIREVVWRASKLLSLIALPLCVFSIILAPQLIQGLYGMAYYSAIPVFRIIMVSATLGVITHGISATMYATEHQMYQLSLNIIGAVADIGVALWLIPRLGLFGAAAASMIAQGVEFVGCLFFCYLVLHAHFPFASVVKFVCSAALAGLILLKVSAIFQSILGLAGGIIIAAVVFLISVSLTRSLDLRDFELLGNAVTRFNIRIFINIFDFWAALSGIKVSHE